MEQILLNGINIDELLEKIGQLIDSKLEKASSQVKESPPLLSRNEVCKLLKISLPTLTDWTKQGWLQSYKMGNRVFYKSNEVEEALLNVSSNKHKKYTKW